MKKYWAAASFDGYRIYYGSRPPDYDYLNYDQCFDTFKEAKKWVAQGFKSDIQQSKALLSEVKKLKKSEIEREG